VDRELNEEFLQFHLASVVYRIMEEEMLKVLVISNALT